MADDKKSIQTIPKLEDQNLDFEFLKVSPHVVKIYANSFAIGYSISDATVVMQNGRTPVAMLNTSFTALKSLSGALIETIALIEKNLGQPILDNKQTSELFAHNRKSEKDID